jgi:hypothetical protein
MLCCGIFVTGSVQGQDGQPPVSATPPSIPPVPSAGPEQAPAPAPTAGVAPTATAPALPLHSAHLSPPKPLGTREALLRIRTTTLPPGQLHINEQPCPTAGEVTIPLHHSTHHPVKYSITYGASATSSPQNLEARLTRDDGATWEKLKSRPLRDQMQMPWIVSIRGREHVLVEIYPSSAKHAPGVPREHDQNISKSLEKLHTKINQLGNKLNEVASAPGVRLAPIDPTTQLDEIRNRLTAIEEQIKVRQQQAAAFIKRLLLSPESSRLVARATTTDGKIAGLEWTVHPVKFRVAGPKSVPGSPLPEAPFTAKLKFRIAYAGSKLFTEPIPVTISASTTELQTEVDFRPTVAQKLEQALLHQPLARGKYRVDCEVEIDVNGNRGYCDSYLVLEVE